MAKKKEKGAEEKREANGDKGRLKGLSVAIGKAMKQIMREKEGYYRTGELARRLTLQLTILLPDDDKEYMDFIEKEGDKEGGRLLLTDETEQMAYYHKRDSKDVSDPNQLPPNTYHIYTNGEKILLPNSAVINYYKMDNITKGETEADLSLIIAFCLHFGVKYDEFMLRVHTELNNEKIINKDVLLNNEGGKQGSTLSCLLHSVFDDYPHFGIDPSTNAMSALFPRGKNVLVLHFAFLPLETDDSKNSQPLQTGTYTFKEENGICKLSVKLDMSSDGKPAEYEGFAIVLNPRTNMGNIWCFLRLVDNNKAEFSIASFRLRNEDRSWQTRVALALDIKSVESRPIVYRMLLYKENTALSPENIHYLAGHLKLNIGKVQILEEYIKMARDYFSPSCLPARNDYEERIYKDLEKHFGPSADREGLFKIFTDGIMINRTESMCTIKFSDKEANWPNKRLFEDQPRILSWLRKHGICSSHNKLLGPLDRDVENMYKKLANGQPDA